MTIPGFRNYHEREAARLRLLLAVATTPALKARLAEQAVEHERLAEGRQPRRASRRNWLTTSGKRSETASKSAFRGVIAVIFAGPKGFR
jgi:hypothetical protein